MLPDPIKNLLKDHHFTSRLGKEISQLKEYFISDKGIRTLLNLYVQAETNVLTEPAGLLCSDSKKFHYFEIPRKKADYLVSLLINEQPKFKELLSELEIKIAKYKDIRDFNAADKCQFFLDEFKAYSVKGRDIEKILALLQYYLTSSYTTSNNLPEGIEIHVHPNKSFAMKYEDKFLVFETEKGYSPSDVCASADKTLCLVEYEKQNNIVDVFNPVLSVELNVFHRMLNVEKPVGNYQLNIDSENSSLTNPSGEKVQISTPKLKLSSDHSEFLLYENKYLWPFLEIVKKGAFDFHHYFYVFDANPKKRFEVSKKGESREVFIHGNNPFKQLFLE